MKIFKEWITLKQSEEINTVLLLLLLLLKMYADGGGPLAACSALDRCSALCLPLFMERSLQYVDCE
jgi:hypothetical protein